MTPIAHIHTDFTTKFGVPRQSGLSPSCEGRIVFEPAYRNVEALRGLDGYDYIWLLWDFSLAHRPEGEWSPTVRPPRLGGNVRLGVWATRSPFRPNPIGLSSVRLERIQWHSPDGPLLLVSGADLMDGTPILDIKPYLPFTDSHPDARAGFAEQTCRQCEPLDVHIPAEVAILFTDRQLASLREILSQDPRPHYQDDPTRVYGMTFAGRELHFIVVGSLLSVCTG